MPVQCWLCFAAGLLLLWLWPKAFQTLELYFIILFYLWSLLLDDCSLVLGSSARLYDLWNWIQSEWQMVKLKKNTSNGWRTRKTDTPSFRFRYEMWFLWIWKWIWNSKIKSIEISKKDQQQHIEKNVLLKVATFPLPQKWYISCGHGGLFHISYRFSMSCHVLFCNFCKFWDLVCNWLLPHQQHFTDWERLTLINQINRKESGGSHAYPVLEKTTLRYFFCS